MALVKLWEAMADKLMGHLDTQEQEAFIRESETLHAHKTRILSPEEDIRRQLNAMNSLEAVWGFIKRRVSTGSPPSFMSLSVVDHQAEVIRIRFLVPDDFSQPFQGEFIPLCDRENHFVRTVLRCDTTFSSSPVELGEELAPFMAELPRVRNIFSIPLLAGNKSIAVITLGFEELDGFSRAKLSSVYVLRDQIAPLVWNLILQEQIDKVPPTDQLTQLPLASCFEDILNREMRRAQYASDNLAVLLFDIHQLKAYNQSFSPQQGDQALMRLVNVIKRHSRGLDSFIRYAGDKIAVISPERTLHQAHNLAEDVLAELQAPYKMLAPFRVSVGVAAFPGDGNTPQALRQVLETALDFAKYQTTESLQSTICLSTQLNGVSEPERRGILSQRLHKSKLEGSIVFEALQARLQGKLWQGPELAPGIQQFVESLSSTLQAIELKVPHIIRHAMSSATYAAALADAAHMTPIEIEKIRLAALLQNVGYIGMPQSLFAKPSLLAPVEKREVSSHPVMAVERVLKPYPDLVDVATIIEYHHEAWDGTGYPVGLRGDNIPVSARILAIADAFAAMIDERPYRAALPLQEALAQLRRGAGAQWDPELVERFSAMVSIAQRESVAEADLSELKLDDVSDALKAVS